MTKFDELSLKIPAFLRGELTDVEMAEIKAFAGGNPEFAADLEFQKSLGQSLKEDAPDAQGLEFGWARLSKAIDEEPAANAVPGMAANDPAPSRFWQYAAAFLACMVIGQTAFMGLGGNDSNDIYQMAGENEAGFAMTVQINASATGKALTDFLTARDGVVTSGPDKDGQYRIAFGDQESCETARSGLAVTDALFKTYSACGER